jgi:hypothetical protein
MSLAKFRKVYKGNKPPKKPKGEDNPESPKE